MSAVSAAPVDAARARLTDLEAKLTAAREALAVADAATTAPTPDDDNAHVAEMAKRRNAVTEAADLVALYVRRVEEARAKLAPLVREHLQAQHADALDKAAAAARDLPGAAEKAQKATAALKAALVSIVSNVAAADALADELRAQGVAVSLADRDLLAIARLAPKSDTAAAWLRAAADVVEYIEAAPARAQERERARQEREAERARRRREDALRGAFGEEERERAIAEVRSEMAKWIGPKSSFANALPRPQVSKSVREYRAQVGISEDE